MKTHPMIISLFVFVLLVSACAPQAETATLPPEPSPIPTPTEISTPTPMPTATPLQPVLMVGGDIPCYAGPGPDYGTLAMLSIGMKAEVLSKDSTGAYWIVQSPLGNGSCWTESRYATIIGQAEGVPVLAANAVPTKAINLPDTPRRFTATTTCVAIRDSRDSRGVRRVGDKQNFFVYLSWSNIKEESGYRLYRDNILLVELEMDTSQYTDNFIIEKNKAMYVVYTLEAFNDNGASPTIQTTVTASFQLCK
ncbi:MAG: hypothetical protein HY869_11560 [Chloroflexi bacterium]|nr:hypothetical protein [Chloroflexota bacterium]